MFSGGLTITFLANGPESVCSRYVVFLGGKLILIAVIWEMCGGTTVLFLLFCVWVGASVIMET